MTDVPWIDWHQSLGKPSWTRKTTMNEWLAFGLVAVICGLLASMVVWTGGKESRPPELPADP